MTYYTSANMKLTTYENDIISLGSGLLRLMGSDIPKQKLGHDGSLTFTNSPIQTESVFVIFIASIFLQTICLNSVYFVFLLQLMCPLMICIGLF